MENIKIITNKKGQIMSIRTYLSPEVVEKLQGMKGWVRIEEVEDKIAVDGEFIIKLKYPTKGEEKR